MGADDPLPFEEQLHEAKEASLGQVLVKAARLVNERSIARMRRDPRYANVRLRHLSIMPHIDLQGTRVTDLAQRMEISKQGVGQLVDEMEGFGMLERVPDPEDGRAKRVCFTARGRASLLDGLSVLGALETDLAEVLGKAELTRLRRLLLKVVAALESPPPE